MEELSGFWKELYEVALEIRDMAPWEFLWSEDKIGILLPGMEHPVYCSVLGRGGTCYGVCVYHTLRGVWGAETLVQNDMPREQQVRYQECLVFYLGNREELSARDRRILAELGLKFRGKNAWPYFRSLEACCFPVEFSEEEAELMLSVLRNLFMAIRAIKENRVKCRFDQGEMVFRTYDSKRDMWLIYADQVKLPVIHYPQPVISDELLVERLKRMGFLEATLEVDLASMGIPVRDKQYPKPFFTRSCIFADHDTGEIELAEPVTPDAQMFRILVEKLIDWIEKYQGKPEEIIVRDEEMHTMMAGICGQLDIHLNVSSTLEAVDQFVSGFLKH